MHAQLNREDSAYGNPNASHRNIMNANSSNEGPTTPPNQQECEQPPPRVGAKERLDFPHSGSMPEFGSEAKLWAETRDAKTTAEVRCEVAMRTIRGD